LPGPIHTLNIVWGCAKVSAGCKNCYAEAWAKRMGHAVWGEGGERRTFPHDGKHWRDPHTWNAKAQKAGVRARVFCSSMADVFEDHPVLAAERPFLWETIAETPWLDWQLLTKRPENVAGMVPWGDDWPANVWLGTTTENQEMLDQRLLVLCSRPARVRFLSVEPQLEEVDLQHTLAVIRDVSYRPDGWVSIGLSRPIIDWVIVGGESGAGARTFQVQWAEDIVRECERWDVACFVKQLGAAPRTGDFLHTLGNKKGADPAEWPAHLRVREFPVPR
jgi:protein gp37